VTFVAPVTAIGMVIGTVLAVATVLSMVQLLVVSGSPASAHEGIASSNPASGAELTEPIDSVTIDFGADIGTTAEIGIVGPDGELPSSTTVTSATEAITEFEPIDQHGTYTVNYLATSVVDGHLLGGSISFTYGQPSSGVMSPLLFGIIAVVILGIGAWLSWRAHVRQRDAALADAVPVDAG
jgi:methionine-rich copper-binding protein CopC